ncbi:hypothetical protein H072_6313 [Dactylellina haptotyla CBS 200.50]|uniref:MYND-type domain-containing protein n=1 Tax=Dactylellina haptotyla (strain CBS 200.50) TaxID=1284197 RepID=S8BX88_DACHA|nr:hypothetical protein H072_6313 [Dactylellina haptotyla CBS 200.50]
MSHPSVFDTEGFYYPIGNSPAINLVDHLPPDLDADILLLGCGDARNILFTLWTESHDTVDKDKDASKLRTFKFTCCDIEGAVIARNILLLAMIIKNEDINAMWHIYYDVFMPENSLKIFKSHLENLIASSTDIELWIQSDIGKILNIGSAQTLVAVRRYWTAWATYMGSRQSIKQLKISYKKGLATITKKKHPKGGVLSVARSGGPLATNIMSASVKHFEHYWKSGTTEDSSAEASLPNQTFALSNYGRKFSLHYGSNPLAGFHLATSIVPVVPDCEPSRRILPKANSDNYTNIIQCAKEEFILWCESFRKAQAAEKFTICFFVDDALELCATLSQKTASPGSSVGIPELSKNDEISKGYFFNHSSDFNIIAMSNLIDHLGFYNIFLSVLPILRRHYASYIHTETLLDDQFDTQNGEEGLHRALGVDPTSLFTLLGIAPIDFLCAHTSLSQVSDYLLEMLGDNRQQYCRMIWKWIPQFHTVGFNKEAPLILNHPLFVYEVDAMLDFTTKIYKKLFETEDFSWMQRRIAGDLKSKYGVRVLQHNTRLTFSLLLQKIKSLTSRQVNWDSFMAKLEFAIANSGILVASCFSQEQNVLNHFSGVDTVEPLKLDPATIALNHPFYDGHRMLSTQVGKYAPITCITLAIPIKRFERLLKVPVEQRGSIPFHLEVSGGRFLNNFGSLRRRFGTLDAIVTSNAMLNIQETAPKIHQDLDGWEGNSNVLYSCMVPTWMILLQNDCKVSLTLVSSPFTVSLISEFGLGLEFFQTKLHDNTHVRLSKKFPISDPLNTIAPNEDKGNAELATSSQEPASAHETSKNHNIQTLVMTTGPHPKIERIIYRWNTTEPKALELLETKAKISTPKLGMSTYSIRLGSESHKVEFPYPIEELVKTSIARRSRYIELDARLHRKKNTPAHLRFPIISLDSPTHSIVAWSVHRINLDRSPPVLIDFTKQKPQNYEWINTVMTYAFSSDERREISSTKQAYAGNPLTEMKESLHTIIIRHIGIQGNQCSVYALHNATHGSHMLVFVKDIRLDLSGGGIVGDCALIPLEGDPPLAIQPHLMRLELAKKLAPVRNTDGETETWRYFSVSSIERCRTWKHKQNCEYFKVGKVPLPVSGQNPRATPICSCGMGIFPRSFTNDPLLKPFLPYATRAAIGPVFLPPYSAGTQSLKDMMSKIKNELNISGSQPLGGNPGTCAVCKSRGDEDQKLMKCGRCKKVEYCSKACQTQDWKKHKIFCMLAKEKGAG